MNLGHVGAIGWFSDCLQTSVNLGDHGVVLDHHQIYDNYLLDGEALDTYMTYSMIFPDASLNSVILHITNFNVDDHMHLGKTSRKPGSHAAMG